MKTERIYQTNRYCIYTHAKVCKVSEKNGLDVIETDRTVFFPEGGGQPSDIGEVCLGESSYAVTYVYDDGLEAAVYHETDAAAGTFNIGDEVLLRIDWDHRFLNMQRHCGEHMLSGAFHNLYRGVNKGFHMSKDYIAIDIDCGGRILSNEEVRAAEDMVNAAIRANYPVDISYYENYEASRHRPVRKDVEHDGQVSIVTIGDMDAPYDCIACCGTHPATSSEVGLLAVYRSEPNKGMTRVYFDCGRAALDKLKADYDIAYSIASTMSSSIEDLPHKLNIQAEHEKELKAQLAALTSYYKKKEAEAFKSSIIEKRANGISVHVFDNEILNINDLLKFGFTLAEDLEAGELLILKDRKSANVLLFSDGSDLKCGSLIKEHAPACNGRGGGRPDNARASFQNADDAEAFVEMLSKMFS